MRTAAVISGRAQEVGGFTLPVTSPELALGSWEGTFALESSAMTPAPMVQVRGVCGGLLRLRSIHLLSPPSSAACGFVLDSGRSLLSACRSRRFGFQPLVNFLVTAQSFLDVVADVLGSVYILK